MGKLKHCEYFLNALCIIQVSSVIVDGDAVVRMDLLDVQTLKKKNHRHFKEHPLNDMSEATSCL